MEVKPVTMESCIEFALTFPGAVADAPFDEDTIVLRHRDSRKWFGLLIHVHGVAMHQSEMRSAAGRFLPSCVSECHTGLSYE